jgi:hypothetical protein
MIGWTRPFGGFVASLVILHFGLRVGVGVGDAVPDLLVPAALLAARRLAPAPAAGLGLGLGLLADALSLTGFGATGWVLAVACTAGSTTRDSFEGETLAFNAVYLLAGSIVVVGASRALVPGLAGRPPATWAAAAVLAGVYAAAAGLAALLLFRALAGQRA